MLATLSAGEYSAPTRTLPLVIRNATRAHLAATYTCTADNTLLAPPQKSTIKIDLFCKYSPKTVPKFKSILLFEKCFQATKPWLYFLIARYGFYRHLYWNTQIVAKQYRFNTNSGYTNNESRSEKPDSHFSHNPEYQENTEK